jgi:recombinational DNA repair protein (RecF pathway)
MHEYVTKAVVLDKATRGGEADARYSFFTERYGKIAARATSSRKIVSKLAGHLEPGTLTSVRIIEQHGTKVVDALKIAKVAIGLRDLAALNQLLGEWEPDYEMWEQLKSATPDAGNEGASKNQFSWTATLAILGWDPRGAVCMNCSSGRPARNFYIPRQEFFCASCAAAINRTSRFAPNHLILV